MSLMSIPLGDAPYASAYTSVGRERCENMYLERANNQSAKAQTFYIKIPGLRKVINGATSNACRGLLTASSGRVFGVFGQGVYEILANWSRTFLFSLTTYSGTVSLTENGNYLLIVDGAHGWTYKYEDGAINMIDPNTDGNEGFPNGATHAICLDKYFLVNDPRTNKYNWSNLNYSLVTTGGISGSGGHWNGINVGEKIAKPDNIVAIADCQNYAWLFGSNSIEVHYDTGDFATGVWKRYESAIIEVGCAAPRSPAKYGAGNSIFWIGSDITGTVGVFTNEGFLPKRISVRGIEQIISDMPTYSDAIGMIFFENGHAFYLLHFPTGDRTLVYDITTGAWHERTFLYRQTGTTHRWRGTYVTQAHGSIVFGDNATDALYVSDQNYYVNDDATGSGVNYIKCVKTSPIGFQVGKLVRYKSIQPILAQGVGLSQNTSEGVGEDPVVLMSYSDDSGVTYSQERKIAIGKQGEYGKRSRLTMLGASRNRVWMTTCTDPVRFLLIGLIADILSMDR